MNVSATGNTPRTTAQAAARQTEQHEMDMHVDPEDIFNPGDSTRNGDFRCMGPAVGLSMCCR